MRTLWIGRHRPQHWLDFRTGGSREVGSGSPLRSVASSPHFSALQVQRLGQGRPGLRLLGRMRERKSRRGCWTLGINCRAPWCRPRGALSGSDRGPDWRGRRDPPPRRVSALARLGARPGARAQWLPFRPAGPPTVRSRWQSCGQVQVAPLTLYTRAGGPSERRGVFELNPANPLVNRTPGELSRRPSLVPSLAAVTKFRPLPKAL